MDVRIITFPSVWHAFRAEKVLKAAGIDFLLIPIPRELSSSCQGLAARIAVSDIATALDLLDAERISMEKRGVSLT